MCCVKATESHSHGSAKLQFFPEEPSGQQRGPVMYLDAPLHLRTILFQIAEGSLEATLMRSDAGDLPRPCRAERA